MAFLTLNPLLIFSSFFLPSPHSSQPIYFTPQCPGELKTLSWPFIIIYYLLFIIYYLIILFINYL